MMSEETYELIERYFRNELSAEERIAFNQRLEKEPGFAQQVEIHREAEELLIDQGVLQMKQKLRAIHTKEEKGGRTQWKIYLNTAVVAIIGIVGVLLYSMKENPAETASSEEKNPVVINQEQKNVSSEKVITPSKENNTSEPKGQLPVVTNSSVVTGTTIPDEVVSGTQPQQETPEQKDTNQTKVTVNTHKEVVDCSKLKITGEVDVKASCIKKNTGNILINSGTIKGGVKPYQFSVSGEDEYTVSNSFHNLSSGQYKVLIKDKNGCEVLLATVEVAEQQCSEEYAFTPSRGETWDIPLAEGHSGEVKIMSRSGEVVFTLPFQSGSAASWNGTDKNSLDLSAGVYLFFISYANGEVVKGHVTILR